MFVLQHYIFAFGFCQLFPSCYLTKLVYGQVFYWIYSNALRTNFPFCFSGSQYSAVVAAEIRKHGSKSVYRYEKSWPLDFQFHYERFWVIWYDLYNLKSVKNTHEWMLLFNKVAGCNLKLQVATLPKITLLRGCSSRF